jgi:trimethylamine--corrinoid protein Co-methyltransferase
LARAGAKVDGVLVKFEPGLLREVLKTAPCQLHPACPQPGALGRDRRQVVVFAPAYGSPFVMDLDKGRRYGTIEDFRIS